jgi:hypothetical protein
MTSTTSILFILVSYSSASFGSNRPISTSSLAMLENVDGYRYSRFCEVYRSWERKLLVTMRQTHRGAPLVRCKFRQKEAPQGGFMSKGGTPDWAPKGILILALLPIGTLN